jgi:hypothetical protein
MAYAILRGAPMDGATRSISGMPKSPSECMQERRRSRSSSRRPTILLIAGALLFSTCRATSFLQPSGMPLRERTQTRQGPCLKRGGALVGAMHGLLLRRADALAGWPIPVLSRRSNVRDFSLRWVVFQFEFTRLHQRWTATAAQMASTTPNGQAPCRNP